jgi:translation initiation factor IF-2
MRVYEIAKDAGVSSAAVIKAAESCGIEASSAISTIDSGDVAKIKSSLVAMDDLAAKRSEKAAKAARARKNALEADAKKLAVHLETALAASEGKAVKTAVPQAKKVQPQKQQAIQIKVEKPIDPTKISISINPKKPQIKVEGPKISVATAPEKPAIRMAPGHNLNVAKREAAREKSAQKRENPHPGFKPLQATQPTGSIKISVAPPPKVRPPKKNDDYFDDERGSRKGKKDREAQKSFEKRAPRIVAPQVPQQGSRISVNEESREISIRGAVIVKDLAAKLDIKPNRLIADLMGLKILASIKQRVEPDIATKVAEKYGFKVTIEHARDKASAKPVMKAIDADDLIPEDAPETLKTRAPVVTFLGHVDHGKTTLMDYIRKEHVAAGEAGGITQQISAYQVEIAGKKITFLDTPGHAAFSAMRARGAQITDIAVIIIAADDGIMPQTEECIRVARQTGVQIMVAITKCDKPTANADRVKQQLQKAGLTPEEWGGDIICCEVSGQTGLGVDNLLENILVQAEILELAANPNRRANGYVIEAELQQGLGPCATLLVSGGTLKVGDAILIGEHFGRVRALIDDHGRRIKEAPPAMPVKCTGLSGVPEAGAEFRVMLDEKRARTLAEQTAQEKKEEQLSLNKASTLDALMSRMANEGRSELNCIVKSDTQGSLEAIVEALRGIKSEKVGLNIIGTGTGNVSLTDVKSAAAGKAIIVGFDIGNDSGVQQQARHDSVRINSFRIIYELLDHVKNCMLDLLPPEYKEVILGHAEIKAIYDIGKLGKIAGSQMLDGKLVAKEKYRIFRNKNQIWDGKVKTLRHFKDEVKEVTGQQECGICFEQYELFQAGDRVECYQLEELPRSL